MHSLNVTKLLHGNLSNADAAGTTQVTEGLVKASYCGTTGRAGNDSGAGSPTC